MVRTALMGASGFVGSRMVEMFHLGGLGEVRPIVRSFGGLARLARFDLDCRLADALDEAALTKAFEGCDVVIHSVAGHPEVIEGSIATTYKAASSAGIKRIVYLSTASVFGQAPAVGTDDSTPISDRQAQDYNNWKVRAERSLLRERQNGSVEIVIIRPGIVFGPRDRWISALASELLSGTAYLVNGGKGICNSIYVDNLVHAAHLATTADGADGQAFTVGDDETVTWNQFYEGVAQKLGIPVDEIRNVSPPVFNKSFKTRIDEFRSLKATQAALPIFPSKLKRSVKAALNAWPETPVPSQWAGNGGPTPNVTMEMTELHQCPYKLPHEKAERLLGYKPIVSFEEGCRRTFEWLRFAGFPI